MATPVPRDKSLSGTGFAGESARVPGAIIARSGRATNRRRSMVSSSSCNTEATQRMADTVLAIDQGTTGTTVFVLDQAGRIRGRAYGEIRQYYPRAGWVEHDPEEIYRSAVRLSKKALTAAKLSARDVRAIGITNQRETFVVWERKTGRPVGRAIVWQCRRSAEICAQLRDREAEVA